MLDELKIGEIIKFKRRIQTGRKTVEAQGKLIKINKKSVMVEFAGDKKTKIIKRKLSDLILKESN